MSASSTPDSFLQKSNEELLYLVQHPALYHPALLAEATRELRRRGASLPAPTQEAIAAVPASIYDAPERSAVARWWPAGALGLAVLGLSWWGLRASSTPEATAPKPASTATIVLEAVQTNSLPSFETETVAQVAQVRRQLSASDRADTTATGRYSRMARRYWLAENAAAYLTAQAQGDSASTVFSGQVDIALEKITWFMKAKAYNQSLTPSMEAHLTEMQHGLQLRRESLKELQTLQTIGADFSEAKTSFKKAAEAVLISRDLRGLPSRQAPIAGNLASIGGSAQPEQGAEFKVVTQLPPAHRNQNPLYVLDGELMPSDAESGEAPMAVRTLPPDSIGRITVVKKEAAVKAFGPRAHDGAIIIFTKAALRSSSQPD